MTAIATPTTSQLMRVLSLSNPWPWAMLHEDPAIAKLVENRSWAPPVDAIGKRFALHAAKSIDKSAFSYFTKLGIIGFPARYDLYPTGVIVGVATIDRVRTGSIDEPPKDLDPAQRKWFFGPFGWLLTDVRRLPEPIAHKGGQGFRWLPDDVVARIEAQVGASRG